MIHSIIMSVYEHSVQPALHFNSVTLIAISDGPREILQNKYMTHTLNEFCMMFLYALKIRTWQNSKDLRLFLKNNR